MSLAQPRKLILQSHLALGDIVMLTAALRELHLHSPQGYLLDTRTLFPELWLNNPYLTALDPADPEVETIGCDVPLVHRSGHVACHYLYGFLDHLSRRLGVRLEPTAFCGDIHLSEQERVAPSPIRELTGQDIPYWLISAGGRYDLTIKWWAAERFQRVIDHFRGRVQFIQVGHIGHHHPHLDGVIDLRGRTNLRQLVRLVYQADGVLCGVTALMHLAAAVPRPADRPGLRPCVVVAGGREPPHWEAYPGHQYLHTVGALACCRDNGCWRTRTRALGDGAPEDDPARLCIDVVGSLPRCMDLISPEAVIGRMETYFTGGVTRFLRKSEARAAARAARLAGPSGFDELPLNLSSVREALETFLSRPMPARPQFHGRGIVICGGGARCFANAWVCINTLRRLGCRLPIQLWHLGRHEMDREMERLVAALQVECIDASKLQRLHPVRRIGAWELKPYAILFSPFREVLLLDADNMPVRDPTFLFATRHYVESGAIFWPDHRRPDPKNPLWQSCGLEVPAEPEFESGQIVVDKARCWPALRLALWCNEHSDFFYQYLHGDKDTFNLAFRRLRTPFCLMPQPPQPANGATYQQDFEGRRLFQHRNLAKWTLFPSNPRIAGFEFEEACLEDLQQLGQKWSGRMPWLRAQSPKGRVWQNGSRREPSVAAWMITCQERETTRGATLDSLAATDWPDLPLQILMDPKEHPDPRERISRQILRAMQQFLEGSTDYFLLLEDDLIFNRHFRHNLRQWRPLRQREVTLGGLYNPGLRELAFDLASHALAVAPESAFGTQALLLSRPTVRHVTAAWNSVNAPADLRLMHLAAKLGCPIYYHAPSLVQHRKVPSVSGGWEHEARDFVPDWRAS